LASFQVQTHPYEEQIDAVPLRRPGRWGAAAVAGLLLALFLYGAATNSAYQWSTYWQYLFDQRISQAALITIELSVLAMALGLVLGALSSVMRMSDNPVLSTLAWLYIWVFRGTPVYVQLVFWGLVTSIYKQIDLGIPFVVQFAHLQTGSWLTPFAAAVIGLGLNQGAYTAEIMRAGMCSVDEGQREASIALGMSGWQATRRIVFPQAMRVIIPPTGNEFISMLKTTSLVIAVPFTGDLYSRATEIAAVLYKPIPLLLVASTWYLAITTALMVGQHFLEKRFSRGASRRVSDKWPQAIAEPRAAALGEGR
jgi:polar amino acid transport system permease protein